MRDPFQFAELLGQLIQQYGYTPGQLAALSGLPKSTIVNWQEGRVKRPREWQPIAQLAKAMRLPTAEFNHLLQACQYPSVAEITHLSQTATDQQLLAFWQKPQTAVSTPRPPFQVIPDLPYFVGRETLLTELSTALTTRPHASPYILQGMGGVGKTALAVRLAYQCRSRFPDGVLWVRLGASDPMAALHTFAQAYGLDISGYSNLDDRSRAMREVLADKQALVILDNAQTSEQIIPFLPPTGSSAVLITTRRQDLLALAGAQRWQVEPFQPTDPAAMQLFEQLLGKTAVSDTAALQEIITVSGGLPLAMAIAASRLSHEPGWTAESFAHRLRQNRLQTFTFESQTVQACFQVSYALLPPHEQQFLVTLGLFEGPDFTSQAAAETAELPLAQTQDYLRHLYRLSLVQLGRPGRFVLHPLVRDFVSQRGQPNSLPFIRYFVGYAQAKTADFPALALEHHNILAALQLATSPHAENLLIDGVKAISSYLITNGFYTDAVTQLETAYPKATDPQDQINLLLRLAWVARQQQDLTTTHQKLQTALEIAQPLNNPRCKTDVLTELGIWAACQGDSPLANTYFEQSLQLAQQHGYYDLLPTLLEEMGAQAVICGDTTQAEAYFHQGLEVAQQHSFAPGAVMLYKSLGTLYWTNQQTKLAQHCFQQGLELARNLPHQSGLLVSLNNLAAAYMKTAEFSLVHPLLQEAFALAQHLGNHKWLCMVEFNIGLLAAIQGNLTDAQNHLSHALVAAQKFNVHAVINRTSLVLADFSQAAQISPVVFL